jgi:protein-L-isoaspartate(D-aspartate) O-methyltransferase
MSQKKHLIEELKSHGFLKDKKILQAFDKVKRENFVLPEHKKYAYVNEPLPILKNQTISQPLTVVAMTDALDIKEGQKILEIGSGSGYQAAILSELIGEKGTLITLERIHELSEFARKNLKNYKNVVVIEGDGSKGCKKEAPFDRIIVTASARKIPDKLLEQLSNSGIMVIPVGNEMYVIKKTIKGIKKEMIGYYNFVPLVED